MWFEGAWWQEMLPDDVRLAVLSLGVGRLTPEQLERAHEQILDKVELLDREGVDVINVGGSPVVTAHGMAGHARLVEDIAARVSRPFVTALQAELEGLRAVGGAAWWWPRRIRSRRRRSASGSWSRRASRRRHDSLTSSATARSPRSIREPWPTRRCGRGRRGPTRTSIYLPCGSLPAIFGPRRDRGANGPARGRLRAGPGRRVPPARRLSTPIAGYGRLLRELAPVAA